MMTKQFQKLQAWQQNEQFHDHLRFLLEHLLQPENIKKKNWLKFGNIVKNKIKAIWQCRNLAYLKIDVKIGI